MDQEIINEEYSLIANRLMPSVTHQINNSMQAVRGALTLAMEEINDPKELATYIHLSLQETERVVQLISQLRQTNFHQTDKKEIDLNQLLKNIIIFASKDLTQNKVNLVADLHPKPISVTFNNHLNFVLLRLLLSIGDSIAAVGGGDLQIISCRLPGSAQVIFSTESKLDALLSWTPGNAITYQDKHLLMIYKIISSNNGVFEIKEKAGKIDFQVDLPISRLS